MHNCFTHFCWYSDVDSKLVKTSCWFGTIARTGYSSMKVSLQWKKLIMAKMHLFFFLSECDISKPFLLTCLLCIPDGYTRSCVFIDPTEHIESHTFFQVFCNTIKGLICVDKSSIIGTQIVWFLVGSIVADPPSMVCHLHGTKKGIWLLVHPWSLSRKRCERCFDRNTPL